MASFEELIHKHYDKRVSTLAKIKSRSFGADNLTLTALRVLVYSQLEGGVKELASSLIKNINGCRLQIGEVRPSLSQWRNAKDLERTRAALSFQTILSVDPFSALLTQRAELRALDRRFELNQMDSGALTNLYDALGLDKKSIVGIKAEVDQIVSDRNVVAHHGDLPDMASELMEKHLRENVSLVGNVLTDMTLQLLSYFEDNLHRS